jgi:putative membrane protein
MFRDYIQADDGSELAMIGAQLDIHSDLNTILDYANNIITKYEDHQLEAVRDGIHSLRSRMQKTIDKGDILEEIRKGIFIHIDKEAEKLISKTAQQTFWGTAISPVAVVDMAIVAWRTMAMIRDIAALYGYRPGFLGSLRLFSRIFSTIAFAGISEIAVNAGSNLLGNTLLSRLSITLAHALGVGMLTIRVGMAACINCRPLPFQRGELHNHLNLLFRGIKNVLTANFVKEEPEI